MPYYSTHTSGQHKIITSGQHKIIASGDTTHTTHNDVIVTAIACALIGITVGAGLNLHKPHCLLASEQV